MGISKLKKKEEKRGKEIIILSFFFFQVDSVLKKNYKHLFKFLRKKGASYYEAKILVKAFINGNVEKFKEFGGKVKEYYCPSEDRWKTNYYIFRSSLRKEMRRYLIEKYHL